jgi:putative endopeptidase
MRIIVSLVAIVIIATGCATKSTQSAKTSERPEPPRFSVNNMDRAADPRKDFARFAFGKWLDNTPIPSDKARWGGFDELAQYNWRALRQILEANASAANKPNSPADKVAALFRSAMDTNKINELGLLPVQRDLARIEAIRTTDDLARTLAYLHNHGVGALFGVSVRPDAKKSDVYALHASQGGLSLPSKDYYFEPRFENIRTSFVAHVTTMLKLAGVADGAAAEAKTIFEVEKSLAESSKAPVELRDALANYNKMPTAEFKSKTSAFPFDLYFAERKISGADAKNIIVGQPKFFEGLQQQLGSRPIADWKSYLRYQVLSDAASFLSEPFEKERFRFYATTLSGTPEMEPRWQRAARVVDRGLGEALGQLYVERYYPAEARGRMAEMVTNLQVVMRERLQKLEWMTEPTRQKALAKFDRFVPRIGHPEKWRDYSSVEIRPDDYFGNVRRAEAFEVRRRLNRLGKKVDKSEWQMTPPTVNAYFQATANQIVFPAGILQPPFFDFTLDDAVNYGAIGAVIGHEITHGFDDQGRRFDAEGNLNDWWTEEDAEKFQARAKRLVEQFNAYTPLAGQHVNGELTLGENIADFGGVSIAFEAFQRSQKNKPAKGIDGFTPEQRFFLSWAQQWRTNFREDALRRQLTTDPHSPGMIRAIGPLVNMQEFQEAFGIKEGDAMYRRPEERVKIW